MTPQKLEPKWRCLPVGAETVKTRAGEKGGEKFPAPPLFPLSSHAKPRDGARLEASPRAACRSAPVWLRAEQGAGGSPQTKTGT